MKAEVLHDVLEAVVGDGQEEREYLGMSQIGRCSRELYFDLVEGREEMSQEARRRCYEGRVHQADVVARIEKAGVPVLNEERELRAPFDGRFERQFLGHVDGEIDGDLLEIKSVEGEDQMAKIRRFGPRKRDRPQCQAYMRYGGYARTLIVYKSRADGATWVCWLSRDDEAGEALEEKAKRVLQAVDDGVPPACECGYCRR